MPLLAQIHINSGGGVTGIYGADQYFTGGAAYTATIPFPAGTPEQLRTSRGGNFSYNFPVPAGTYTVSLHFFESSSAISGAGQRVFSVSLNGSPVIPSLDIFAAAGLNSELVKTFPITATNAISIVFTTITRNAVVSAIDIMPVATAPANPFPGCASDGNGGITCTGSIRAGTADNGHPSLTWGGITYYLPLGDGTGKGMVDSGVLPCFQTEPGPICHQFVWQ